jgi:hypothetical protein
MSAGYLGNADSNMLRCYSLRTFERFLNYLGIIEIADRQRWGPPLLIRKSELFDRLLCVFPPASE